MVDKETCTSCGKEDDTVERRYSCGIYAGRLCEECAMKYRDHCGIDREQCAVEELDEFAIGGYDAIYGED
jgi:hypothetical protein